MTTLTHYVVPTARSTEMLTMSEQLARARLDERAHQAREDQQAIVAMRLANARRWDRLAAVARSRANRARSSAR
ncbi:MAG: hypothetical protein QOK42_2749 [Frankiaceae bacterium]|jgi:hypothetical protein|nr:hypothetical protein [Frankiaceae bacterium]MDX6225653.1 hypothetical protein [Frankiales bacterium]MDX6272813.1 hypothetical protein [Frankiales bacterium]